MRQIIRDSVFGLLLSGIALMLGGCGESPSAAQSQPPAQVHGDLIASVQNSGASTPVAPAALFEAKPEVAAPVYALVGFDKLASYDFEVDDTPVTNQPAATDKANDQIPAYIKAFNRKKVTVTGFMLPLKVVNGTVNEFLIMRNQSLCCFGTVPKINEWVSVKTAGPGVKPVMDVPVSICGTLHVGATRENGYLIGIYQMDGDKLVTTDN
jgi:hypothetical protein